MFEIAIGLVVFVGAIWIWARARQPAAPPDERPRAVPRFNIPSRETALTPRSDIGKAEPDHAQFPIEDLVCEITYENDKGEMSNRIIRPTNLKPGPNAPMLYAYCESARSFRTFRTDRISEVIDHDGEILDIATYLKRHVDADIDIASTRLIAPAPRPAMRRTRQRTPQLSATLAPIGPLQAEVIVFTGRLESMSRAHAQAIAKTLGAEVIGNVTKRTTLVVAGADAGFRLKTAQSRGIKVISEDEWKTIISPGEG